MFPLPSGNLELDWIKFMLNMPSVFDFCRRSLVMHMHGWILCTKWIWLHPHMRCLFSRNLFFEWKHMYPVSVWKVFLFCKFHMQSLSS